MVDGLVLGRMVKNRSVGWEFMVDESVLIWSMSWWSVTGGLVECLSVGHQSVIGGSVEDLLVGRWSVVGGWCPVSGSGSYSKIFHGKYWGSPKEMCNGDHKVTLQISSVCIFEWWTVPSQHEVGTRKKRFYFFTWKFQDI